MDTSEAIRAAYSVASYLEARRAKGMAADVRPETLAEFGTEFVVVVDSQEKAKFLCRYGWAVEDCGKDGIAMVLKGNGK